MPRPLAHTLDRIARARALLPRLGRLLAFFACVNLLLGALWAHAARARLSESLLGVGAGLMRYAGALQQEAPRTLMLNGLPLQLSVGSTEHGVDAVLDHFHALCQRRSGQLAAQGREARAQLDDRRPTVEPPGEAPEDGLFDGVLRIDRDDVGVVACLDMGGERVGPQALARRLRAFAETGDVSRVGDLRYVIAERGPVHTVFVTLWTEGELDLGRMFPAEGDVAGVDVPDVPRPKGGRRLLSAWEQGQTPALTQYSGPGLDAPSLDAFYRRELPIRGWVIHEAAETGPTAPRVGFVAERGRQMAAFSFVDDPSDGAVVTVSTLRRPVGP